MRILAIGDVTSPAGLSHLAKNLWKYREENKIDFVIVNGENASFITGISEEGEYTADIIEALRRRDEIFEILDSFKTKDMTKTEEERRDQGAVSC